MYLPSIFLFLFFHKKKIVSFRPYRAEVHVVRRLCVGVGAQENGTKTSKRDEVHESSALFNTRNLFARKRISSAKTIRRNEEHNHSLHSFIACRLPSVAVQPPSFNFSCWISIIHSRRKFPLASAFCLLRHAFFCYLIFIRFAVWVAVYVIVFSLPSLSSRNSTIQNTHNVFASFNLVLSSLCCQSCQRIRHLKLDFYNLLRCQRTWVLFAFVFILVGKFNNSASGIELLSLFYLRIKTVNVDKIIFTINFAREKNKNENFNLFSTIYVSTRTRLLVTLMCLHAGSLPNQERDYLGKIENLFDVAALFNYPRLLGQDWLIYSCLLKCQ